LPPPSTGQNDFLRVPRLADAPAADRRPARVAPSVLCVSLTAILLAAFFHPASARTDQPSYDTVGAIDGEAISVQGPLNIEVVQGRTRTILRSGSDIRVNSGQAQIDLVEGGHIAVCGPAHLSVLKSVNLLTLALDTGTIHAHIEGSQPTLTIYTALLQAKPVPIGDAPQDTLVGFDQTGAMCIRADSGAVRVEQQLTAQTIVVPQSGEVLITNGQLESLRSGVTHCSCELQLAKTLAPTSPQPEVSRLRTPEEMQKAKASAEVANPPAAMPKPAEKDAPVYQVFMPPLSYDASAKVQRDNYDSQLIVLVRRVRVRPTLIFQGLVEGSPVVAQEAASPAAAAAKPVAQAPAANPRSTDSVIGRVRAFFHRLFS